MASFPAKIGWNRPRKRENKNYRSVPTRRVIENSKKIAKKFKKLKNSIMDSFQAKIRPKRQRKREKKNNCFVLSNPTRNRKFQKNSKKILKIKKYHYDFISRKNRLEKAEK